MSFQPCKAAGLAQKIIARFKLTESKTSGYNTPPLKAS